MGYDVTALSLSCAIGGGKGEKIARDERGGGGYDAFDACTFRIGWVFSLRGEFQGMNEIL